MLNDNKKIAAGRKAAGGVSGKLFGLGIGPGDPRLLTLRAREILDSVDTIFVPKAKDDGLSHARTIVAAATSKPKRFVELTFLMTSDRGKLESCWLDSARKIADELRKKRTGAFVTLGDPFIYSTYIYLLDTLRKNFPEIAVETVPGITSFNAAAASCGLPLLKGSEKMAVIPVTGGLSGLRRTLKSFDTVVLMKIGSRLDKVLALLKKTRLIKNSILVSRAGTAGERIIRDLSSLKDEKLGYLSVIIVKRKAGSGK